MLPTDTVYGIAADAFDADAVPTCWRPRAAAATCRRRCWSAPPTTLDALATGVPGYARALSRSSGPARSPWCCRQQTSLQWDLGDTRGTVAVRMPDHELAREILERTGPLAVSSANLTGRPAATDADQAEEMLGELVAVIVDAGASPGRRGLDDRRRHRRPGPRAPASGRSRLEELNAVLEPLGQPTLTDEG